jgi:hypothetical protein
MKLRVEFSVQSKLEICNFHKKVFRKQINPAELEAYLSQVRDALGAFVEQYKDVPFFSKYKTHTFTALSAGIQSDRWPKNNLVLAFEHKTGVYYFVATTQELKVSAAYANKRLLAEAKYIEYNIPDIGSS